MIRRPFEKLICLPQASGESRCQTWKYQVEPDVISPPEEAPMPVRVNAPI